MNPFKRLWWDFWVMVILIATHPFHTVKNFINSDITGDQWRHKKTGKVYVLISDKCLLEADLTSCVAYTAGGDGTIWIRSTSEFFDGRFEKVG